MDKVASLRIDDADLKCKSGCGYYGIFEWDGYCSKCHQEHLRREQLWTAAITELEKLKQEYEELFTRVGEEVKLDFQEFVYHHSKHTNGKLPEIDKIEDVSEYIQSLYQLFSTKFEVDPIYNNVKEEDIELLLDYAEKYLMTPFYRILFCPTNTTDEEKDLAIQNRIRQLNWVSAKHLDCKIDVTNPEVKELVYAAIIDILGMDSAKTPQDKLNCIIRCCDNIFLLLQKSIGRTVSMDELLPAFIFVVLKCNPTRLKSNINYITRFCRKNKLISGESAFFFALLDSAVCFIEGLSAADLDISDEEFNQYMSGEIVPSSTCEFTLMICEPN